jgi:hypothetical protein
MNKRTHALIFVGMLIGMLTAQFGIEFARAAFWQWSKTSTNNATADPSINWAEGMSPSAVNDSARAMMARLAEQSGDTSGSLLTSGSSTAYTVTTNQGFPTPTPNDGQLISITMNVTNGTAPTLSVDSGTPYAIEGVVGVNVPSGTMIAGSPYSMKYSAANNAWILLNFYNYPALVPIGGLIPYTGFTSPSPNYILPAGQCISTTTYATYWALLGSPAPGGCTAGNFAVIDLRGRIIAAIDNLGGTAAGRMTSAAGGCGANFNFSGVVCPNGTESFTIAQANFPIVNFAVNFGTITTSISGSANAFNNGSGTPGPFTATLSDHTAASLSASTTIGASTAASGGSGTALSRVQPTMGLTYLLRVL